MTSLPTSPERFRVAASDTSHCARGSSYAGAIIVALGGLLGACSVIPDLPDEFEMPVQGILHNAVCELHWAFEDLSDPVRFPNFKADQWAAAISLSPKVDVELSARLGLTGKSTTDPKVLRYVTWTLGTSPGLEYDVKGHRDGSASFSLHSSQLLFRNGFSLPNCDRPGPDAFESRQYLGVQGWLERLIPRHGSGLDLLTNPDKPVFNSQIIIKYDGGYGGPTWFIPNGTTVSATFFGSRIRDETLSIAFTPDPKKIAVNTLPTGAPIVKPPVQPDPSRVSPAAQQRLDRIQQDEILRNLRIQGQ
ncbi:hypothetical protein QA649_11325 [Bradyrhizobium sp. CB1717]|uniref:hypothetical protein n=1 Tax=Bradyrhizobium sp. CB1717 TaxID=3039154 RepID=UPI0024B09CA8|nr:hypothetical protein [Bradyrhizobium sp. CB1717]WFU26768.1 hypothetical protein QA649_11325 [Bradyrhizobium sp. CB1717]